MIGYAAGPEQLTAMRLHALLVNPALTGLDYIEWVGRRGCPGLALLVCSRPAPVADRVRALRARRRRLDHQAVPSRGAGGADRGGPAPPPGRRAAASRTRSSAPASWRSARTASTPTPTASRRRSRARSTSCCTSSPCADGRVLEREEIYQRVWGYTMARGDRSVDVFVRKLRQKLERDLAGLALRPHALRGRLPVRRRARRQGSIPCRRRARARPTAPRGRGARDRRRRPLSRRTALQRRPAAYA